MDFNLVKKALDEMGLALIEHNHQWSNELRSLYEKAVKEVTSFSDCKETC